MKDNEIRRKILKLLYQNFRNGKPHTEGLKIVNSIPTAQRDIFANLHYLEDKDLVNVIWRTGSFPVAKINASGIDLLEDESEFNRKFPVSVTYDSSINIGNVGGDVAGVGISGSGNLIGTRISGSQIVFNKLEPEFRDSLQQFLTLIHNYGRNLSPENAKSLKDSIDTLAQLAEGLKSGQVVQDEEKRDEIKSEEITLADKLAKYFPQVAESIASATPLAPFSKVIGEGTGYFADWIRKKLAKRQKIWIGSVGRQNS